MLQTQDDKDSFFKVAQLVCAFGHERDVNFIEKILETKGDINYKIPDHLVTKSNQSSAGCTALDFTNSYFRKNIELKVVQLLLKYGVDITIKNDERQTALRANRVFHGFRSFEDPYWTLQGKLSNHIVDLILSTHVEKSITENPADRHGFTHFHIACMANHSTAVQFFLNNGVSVDLFVNGNSPLFPGCTPLHIAVKSCALEVVKLLLIHGANRYLKDKEGMSVVHWLIERNRKIVDFVVLEGNEWIKDWFQELRVNQQITSLLLNSNTIKSSIFIDEVGLSDFHVACTTGDITVVEQLLGQVAEIDHRVNADSHLWPGYTALHFAAHFDLHTVKLLVSKGASITIESTNGYTPFDICLEKYTAKDIHSLMLTQPNWKSIALLDGKTKLLDLVSAMQYTGRFRLFLDEQTVNVNTSVSKDSPLWPGYTPLHLAVLFSEQTKNRSNYTFTTIEYVLGPRVEAEFNPSLELVEECLRHGADVTAKDLFGCTPLHLAFRYQKTDTIKMLLRFHHSTINPVNKYNLSHLHIVCTAADEETVKKLLQSGAKVDLPLLFHFKFYHRSIVGNTKPCVRQSPPGTTPLHIAVASRCHEVTKLLVDNGADVNAVDANGVTPIHRSFAEQLPDDKISKILLSDNNLKEVIAPGVDLSHLHVASLYGNVDAAKRLLDLGTVVGARFGCESALNDFYARYATFNREVALGVRDKDTALHVAMERESIEVVNLLIKRGADILAKNGDEKFPFHSIISPSGVDNQDCLTPFVELLSQNEALMSRVEQDSGLTAIHMATFQADTATVRKLIDRGVNVHARINDKDPDFPGCTPLHLMIQNLCCNDLIDSKKDDIVEITKLLLAAGADVTLPDADGDTPLHSIFKYWLFVGEFQILLELMFNSFEDFHVNPVGRDGLSHFHIACLQDNAPIIKKFVEHGVDINAPINFFNISALDVFESGSMALHLIIESNSHDESSPRVETIDFLLEHGANVNAQNANGDTPLHIAVKVAFDRVDIFRKLIMAGADLNKLNALGETPFATLLLQPTSSIDLEGIRLFIEHGCCANEFNSITRRGYLLRPLCILFDEDQADSTDLFEVLFKNFDVTKTDTSGRTAIHNLVSVAGYELSERNLLSNGDVSVEQYSILITKLCKMGCDIDSQDQTGATALHFATRFKNDIAIAALLMNGADVNIVDRCGKTAFTYSFDSCECQKSDEEHQHNDVINTLYMHARNLAHLELSLNDINKNLLSSCFLHRYRYEVNADRIDRFLQDIRRIHAFEFEEDSILFRVRDMLSETGAVANYPLMRCDRRLVINKFFENIDVYLADYVEVIGLLKLQFRKAIKRTTLIKPARESLKISVGFPLPEICCDIVLRFLSNSDLEILISSTNEN